MSITFQNTPCTSQLSFPAITGAASYRITLTVLSKTTTISSAWRLTSFVAVALSPGSNCVFKIYSKQSSTGIETLSYTGNTILPALTAAAFTKAALGLGAAPVKINDISSFSSLSKESIANTLFTTGDKIQVQVVKGGGHKDAVLVNTGGTISTSAGTVYIPFDKSSASTIQTMSLKLKNNSVQTLSYNTATQKITIAGIIYKAGDSVMIDSKLMKIVAV